MTVNIDSEATDEANDKQVYDDIHRASEALAESMREFAVGPIAKEHFRQERGHPLNQTLPEKQDAFQFDQNGFEALILPEEREVLNYAFDGKSITGSSLSQAPEVFNDFCERASELWEETFGEWHHMSRQPDHPGKFPLNQVDIRNALNTISEARQGIIHQADLELIAQAAENEDYGILSEIFETSVEEIWTPGGTDLSAIRHNDGIEVPYNDGNIAILRPLTDGNRRNVPVRGCVVGYDDTPVGVFAHVLDVTNLDPHQTTTKEAVKDAMGFDREIDPFNPPSELSVGINERVRLQGDLRVEKVGDQPEDFIDEHARRTRRELYREELDSLLNGVTVSADYVRRRSTDVDITDILRFEVTPNGEVSIDLVVNDSQVELLGYVHLLFQHHPSYHDWNDIPYVEEPNMRFRTFATTGTREALVRGREEVREALQSKIQLKEHEIEQEARNAAADVEAAIDVPQQVNLPIDNHMALVKDGFAPDVDTEPVPVVVPEETILHIIHDEHNTVNISIDPGVYRFSLLPRGLRPPAERPRWPEE